MVDTAVFGFFHRSRPNQADQADVKLALQNGSAPDHNVVESTSGLPSEQLAINTGPAREPADSGDTPSDVLGQELSAPDYSVQSETVVAYADQIGLTPAIEISLAASLPLSNNSTLEATSTGIYMPIGAPQSRGEPQYLENPQSGLSGGTRILTSRGEVEVEAIGPGDLVLALRGPSLLAVEWVGAGPAGEAPVWIEAGALGRNLPRRPLCVGPDHAIFVDPEPVLARSLVNGTTIRLLDDRRPLFLIDVGPSDVLFAEGVPLASNDRGRALQAGD